MEDFPFFCSVLLLYIFISVRTIMRPCLSSSKIEFYIFQKKENKHEENNNKVESWFCRVEK